MKSRFAFRPFTAVLARSFYIAAFCSTASVRVGAQQVPDTIPRDTTRLAPIVVTATRVPIASAASPATVAVVSGQELRARGITSVVDALRDVPGASFARAGSFGGTTSLFLRGGESKYVKVLIDGIPVNDPGGAFDFGTLTVDNVERIEIVRGPVSVLYGADAVTGVIQIFTRRGRGEPRALASVRGGSYGSRDLDGTLVGAIGSGDFSVALARHDTRGVYEFNNAYHNNVLSGAVRLSLDSRTDLRASLRYTDYAYHYPTSGGGDVVDSNAFRAEDKTAIGLEIGRMITPRIEARLSLASNGTAGGTDDRQDTPASGGLESEDRLRRRGADLRTNVDLTAATTLTLGAQVEQEDERSASESVFGTFRSTSVFSASRRNRAAYAQVLARVTSAVVLTTGARVDDNERFGRFATYRAGANWMVGGTSLRGSTGTAFREPSFFENYATGYVTGNPGLAPERSSSWEVGVRQNVAGDRVVIGVTHYAQHFHNMIDYTGSTNACGASYCNVAHATAVGREIELRVLPIAALSIDANLSHLETRVITPGFDTSTAGLYRTDEALIRRPTTSWNVGTAYRTSRGGVDVRVAHVGRRTDRDFRPYPAIAVVDRAYTLTDVAGELPFAPGFISHPASLTFRIENLFDVQYESIFNFRSPRRTVLVGGRIAF